mmetsp:Transcript_10090/g.10568  ORF Transcript_10090/g.10568 Transcript_10090/m.10568 type:complete len:248 (+) Transcript_10090:50-793(+)
MSENNNNEPMENWKQFQGTELGGLLTKIYGNDSKPQINYPKPKTKQKINTEPFLPCGNSITSTDPRKSTKREVNINVPQVGKGKKQSYSAIDYISHRKNENVIKAEIDDIVMRNSHYRPAHQKAISTESEKDKLAQICTYKGGKGLPSELIHPIGEAPFEVEAKRREAERMSKLRAKYRGTSNNPPPQPRALTHTEEMEVQLTQEINERCDYLESMKQIGGLTPAETNRIQSEISQRVNELKRLTNS